MPLKYNKRAILKVVNNSKSHSHYFCVLVLILFLVICGKQFNKKAYLVAKINSKDFKKEDSISTKYKLNTTKYKGAVFRSNKLTNQPKIDYNIGSNKPKLKYNITSNKSRLECNIGFDKSRLECNIGFSKSRPKYNIGSNKYRLKYGMGSNKFKIIAKLD